MTPATKTADPAADAQALAGALAAADNAELRQSALRDVARLAGLGLLGGAGLRGLVALNRAYAPRKPRARPSALEFGVPVAGPKTAQAGGTALPGEETVAGWLGQLGAFGGGAAATTKPGIPWYLPATFAAALGGAGGGYLLADRVAAARRRAAGEAELEAAKRRFAAALAPDPKTAADADPDLAAARDALGRAYRALAGAVTKAAGEPYQWPQLNNTAGAALGVYGTGALLASLLAGAAMYERARRQSPARTMDRALARHRQAAQFDRPLPLFAVPQPAAA